MSKLTKQQAQGPDAAAALLKENALGCTVESFHVFGINSLKTLQPPTSLAGGTLTDVAVEDSFLLVTVNEWELKIDLQRTGAATWFSPSTNSTDGARLSTVTGQILFTDGSRVDFVEPAKTKRIAFWLSRPE